MRSIVSVLCILIVTWITAATIGYFTVENHISQIIMHDAEDNAKKWSSYIAKNLDGIAELANGGPLLRSQREFIEHASGLGNVFRFKLFSPDGRQRLVSDELEKADSNKGNQYLWDHNPIATRVIASGHAYTEVNKGTGEAGRPVLYAETYTPVWENGAMVAVVEVYVDQTARQTLYRSTSRRLIFQVVGILIGVLSIPLGIMYQQALWVKKANAALTESETRFKDIAETAGDWIWEMGADLRFSFMSERFFEVVAVGPDDILGKTREEFSGIVNENEHWQRHFDDLANHRAFRDFKYTATVPGSGIRHIQINGKPVFNSSGIFMGYRGTGTDRTAEVEAHSALKESETQFRNLIDGSLQGVFIHSDWKLLFTNQTLVEMFNYESAEEILALNSVEHLIDPAEHERMQGYILARKTGKDAPEIYETRGVKKDGALIWLEIRVKSIDWYGQSAFQCVVMDISERKSVQEKLQLQNERFNAALSNMSQGLCMFDSEQRIIVSNERYADMYGLLPEQVKPGTTLSEIVEYRIANGIYAGENPDDYRQERQQWVSDVSTASKVHELSDGRSIAVIRQPTGGGGWLTTHEDVTEMRQVELRLAYQVHHDALTDLPNRLLLCDRMKLEMKRARRGVSFALFCLDLDGFKDVNDTLGHAAGDQLLIDFAARLRSCVRETDTVARLGGDEFAIIQTSMKQPDDAIELAKRICQAANAPYGLGQSEVVVQTSVGITIAPGDGCEFEQLLKNADMALYRAKNTDRGTYCLFEKEIESSVMERHALAIDLRKAIASEEFELYYQPLVDLQHNRISGFEALLRWHHPERGMVSPIDFIPIAEETGTINQIGEWVLDKACNEANNWPQDIKVAVNVSPAQFKNGNLLQIVENALTQSGLSASRLEIEATESVLLQNEAATLAMLHRLRGLGLRISMDDFGTGYSSLSYLQSFPFDKIKIDASFVRDLSPGHVGIGIIGAVVGLASRLNVTTVAEGVETQEQLHIVRGEGCTEGQGYFFARPMPANEISVVFLRQLRQRMQDAMDASQVYQPDRQIRSLNEKLN